MPLSLGVYKVPSKMQVVKVSHFLSRQLARVAAGGLISGYGHRSELQSFFKRKKTLDFLKSHFSIQHRKLTDPMCKVKACAEPWNFGGSRNNVLCSTLAQCFEVSWFVVLKIFGDLVDWTQFCFVY